MLSGILLSDVILNFFHGVNKQHNVHFIEYTRAVSQKYDACLLLFQRLCESNEKQGQCRGREHSMLCFRPSRRELPSDHPGENRRQTIQERTRFYFRPDTR